jgi:splicing factor 3A subunit 2
MSSYEQKIQPPDKRWQYLLFAAEPYETIAFKIPAREIDRAEDKYWNLWNKESKQVLINQILHFNFKPLVLFAIRIQTDS